MSVFRFLLRYWLQEFTFEVSICGDEVTSSDTDAISLCIHAASYVLDRV